MTYKTFKSAAASFALALVCAAPALTEPAAAQDNSQGDVVYTGQMSSFTSRAPVLAVVGLREQRISIYDSTGARILESPISSGQTGYETPAGIYSIVQKEEDHHSNLYDDASMPFMERITWSGMALHAGELPGRPASHGCVRLPLEFAERLYQRTDLGMRVVVAREEIAPVEIAQPGLFSTNAGAAPVARLEQLRTTANARAAEADAASAREKDARGAAAEKAAEVASAAKALSKAEAALAKAGAEAKAAEAAREKANTPARTAETEEAKTKALAKVEAAQAQLQAAQADAASRVSAAASAQEEARAAAAAMTIAVGAAEEAKRDMSPVSVLVSRKTQRLYIRKNNYPVFEAPVLIRDADKPIGTFVFTALGAVENTGEMRWNVVSLYKNANIEPFAEAPKTRKGKGQGKGRRPPPPAADAAAAQAALDRFTAPQEAAERISAVVLPGSSLIISDEAPSVETGKDTDFVVFMSGEPQGGIAIRSHNNTTARRDNWGDDEDDGFWSSSRGRRSSMRGFSDFFSD